MPHADLMYSKTSLLTSRGENQHEAGLSPQSAVLRGQRGVPVAGM